MKKLFSVFNRFLCEIDAGFFSGFLGELPTDIWSHLYTTWLRLAGAHISPGSLVHHKVKIWRPENLYIGRGVRVPASTDLAGMGKITIGDYTLIGANVSFITNNHPMENPSLSWQEVMIGVQKPITVGKYCWLMNNSSLVAGKKGLEIGDYTWIASTALVTSDTGEAGLWAGVPAKKTRDIYYRQ